MPETPDQNGLFDFKIEYTKDFILKQYRIPKEAADQLDEIYPEVFKGKKVTIKRLHRLCKKFPNIPQFKNFLSIAYDYAGNYKKAIEINGELIKQHPGYLFAKLNRAEDLIANDQLDAACEILGKEMHIHKLYPDRDTFHIDEVIKYYSTAIQYLLKAEKADGAKLRFEFINDIDPDFPETERSLFDLMQYNLMQNMERHVQQRRKERRVESRSYSVALQTDQSPSFTHPEIEELYKHGLDIPEEIIQTILELPRESLITDLERVLEDTICRYDYFYNKSVVNGWNEIHYNFSIHAILLLTELRSQSSLDKILGLLRQGEEFWEFWYGDLLEALFSESLAVLASDNLQTITNIVKEPDMDAYCRNAGVTALENVAKMFPERRKEVIGHFEDLIQFHLSQLDNDRIIDTALLSFLVWCCVNISAEELLPSIRKLYEHDLIHETMVGDLKDVEKDIKGDMADRGKQPETIFERYESLYKTPFTDGFPPTGDYPDNKDTMDLFSDFREDTPPAALPFKPGLEPETNPYSDTGRNDPCPCGSGKKYKKCCL